MANTNQGNQNQGNRNQSNQGNRDNNQGQFGSGRGFASMDPERQREIARKGGASVPSEKRSFSQDRSLAAQAGRKGGEASHGSRNKESRASE